MTVQCYQTTCVPELCCCVHCPLPCADWDKVLPHLDYALFCIKSPIPGAAEVGAAAGWSLPACRLTGWLRDSAGTLAFRHTAQLVPTCLPCPPAPAEKYEWITKRKIGPALGFVDELEQRKIPYWVSRRWCCRRCWRRLRPAAPTSLQAAERLGLPRGRQASSNCRTQVVPCHSRRLWPPPALPSPAAALRDDGGPDGRARGH